MFVAQNNKVVYLFGISDKIKETSKLAIQKLKKLDIEVHLLSGDNDRIVRHVAEKTGINTFRSGMLPGMKVE